MTVPIAELWKHIKLVLIEASEYIQIAYKLFRFGSSLNQSLDQYLARCLEKSKAKKVKTTFSPAQNKNTTLPCAVSASPTIAMSRTPFGLFNPRFSDFANFTRTKQLSSLVKSARELKSDALQYPRFVRDLEKQEPAYAMLKKKYKDDTLASEYNWTKANYENMVKNLEECKKMRENSKRYVSKMRMDIVLGWERLSKEYEKINHRLEASAVHLKTV